MSWPISAFLLLTWKKAVNQAGALTAIHGTNS